MKSNFRYTAEQLDFLEIVYRYRSIPVLTRAFNAVFGTDRTEGQIKSTLCNHRITCGRTHKDRFHNQARLLTDDQEQFVRKGYLAWKLSELTLRLKEKFGTRFTTQQIKTFTSNHGITSGRSGCFEKGLKPWNTGTKGLLHGSSTSFKKGHVPANIKPLGHERICSKDGFVLIKVAEKNPYTGAPTRYKHKHVHVWEQANGPVPDGMVVAFRDGDKLNTDIENLMLRSKAEMLRLNKHGYKNAPADLKPSILAVARLEVKTFALLKTDAAQQSGDTNP